MAGIFQPHPSSTYNTLETFFLGYIIVVLITGTQCFVGSSKCLFAFLNYYIIVVYTPTPYITGLILLEVVEVKRCHKLSSKSHTLIAVDKTLTFSKH